MPRVDPIKEELVLAILKALQELAPGDYEVYRIDNLNVSVRFQTGSGPRRFVVKLSEQY